MILKSTKILQNFLFLLKIIHNFFKIFLINKIFIIAKQNFRKILMKK